jgi:hypothetical protein
MEQPASAQDARLKLDVERLSQVEMAAGYAMVEPFPLEKTGQRPLAPSRRTIFGLKLPWL